MNHALVESMIAGRLEDALYQTCHLLLEDNITSLENSWVSALARLGDVEGISAVSWYSVCKDVWDSCKADGIHVKSALLLTGKICMLSRQLAGTVNVTTGLGTKSLAALRNKVISYFPENGMRLSIRGIETFNRILPPREDERAFAERLLIGLSQLWEESDTGGPHPDLQAAMEYLLRKKQLTLHCASIGKQDLWPYPSLDESDKGDLVWFLWGAWMLKFGWAEILWRLFSLNYKRSMRTERIGLLMACRGILSIPTGVHSQVWGDDERMVFDYIEQHAGEMWREASGASNKPRETERDKQEQEKNRRLASGDVWNYVPRGAASKHDEIKKAPADYGKRWGQKERYAFPKYENETDNENENEYENDDAEDNDEEQFEREEQQRQKAIEVKKNENNRSRRSSGLKTAVSKISNKSYDALAYPYPTGNWR